MGIESGDADRQRRLDAVLAAYRQGLVAGRAPDQRALIGAHPDLADDLAAAFAAAEPPTLAAPPRPAVTATADGSPETLAFTGPRSAAFQPRRFGDYELLAEIARGGMGVVYKARQVRPGRIVALKMILAGRLASAADIERFRTEAEAVANLDHPNIVPIYEVGEIDGQHFFSMKLINGGNLAARMSDFRLPILDRKSSKSGASLRLAQPQVEEQKAKLINVIIRVARAVHYAHQRGILHRDLKPANILIDGQGQPLVTDFGLAKRVAGDGGLTQSGAVLGTPGYMAPEQAAAKKGLSVAVDVYSIGAMLYELLTGQPPFQADTPLDTLLQVLEREPTNPRSLNRRVDRDLETICLKCLAKEPERRFASAEALADDLSRYLAGEPIRARRSSAGERAVKWARRRPAAAALVAVSVASAVALLIGGLWFNAKLQVERAEVQAQRTEAHDAKEDADAARHEAEKLGETATRANEDAERERQAARQARELAENRLGMLSQANGQRALDEGDPLTALVWFADALKYDHADPRREEAHRVRLAAVAAHAPKLQRAGFLDLPAGHVALSPDGKRVLVVCSDPVRRVGRSAGRGEVRVGPIDSIDNLPVLLRFAAPVSYAAFSPDGTKVVTAVGPHYLFNAPNAVTHAQVWDIQTGKPLTAPLPHRNGVHFAVFSPDGKRLATTSFDGTARIWNVATSKPVTEPLVQGGSVLRAAFSPDGKRLATLAEDVEAGIGKSTVQVWDTTTGKPVLKPLESNGWLFASATVEFAPDGRLLAATSGETFRVWDAVTGDVVFPEQPTGWCRQASFSPDGKRLIVVAGSDARVWDVATGKPLSAVLKHDFTVSSATFSPDGRTVATSSGGGRRDGEVRVWNATTGEPLTPPLRQALPARAAAFTSDGRSVVVASGAEGSDTGETRLWEVRPPGAEAVLDRWEGKRSGWSWIDKEGRRAISWHGNIARVWDARTGQPQTPPLSHPWPIGQAALSPDGRRLLVVDAGLRHSRFRLWDLETGRPFTGMLPTSDSFSFIYWAFSPDSRLLVLVGENTRVLDMTTGEAVGKVLHHDRAWEPNRAALSADGRFVATASDDWMARVWELSSGRLVLPPRRHSQPVQSINFSPAGDVLVTTTGRHAFLWNCQTGQLCSPPLHHGDGLACAAVSPDGRWVATGGGNGSNGEIRIWDAATGQPVSAALQHPRRVSFVRFREDGKVVEASTADGLVWNWSLPSDRLPVEVCSARAQLAAGQRVSPVGGLEPLDAEAFRDAWQRLLAEHGPPSLGHPAPAVLAWERAEAEAAKSAGDWHAVERHYRQVLLAGGDPRTVYPLIGSALGSAKLWSAAADALAQSVDADNADPEVWHQLAVASLLAGRADAYRRLCLRLVDRFAADADPATASQLLWTCTLAPNAGVEPERLRKLAEQARPRDADATAVLRHAAALYRLARFDDVLKELVPVTTRDAANSPRSWLFEAMAYHHLGQHEKARKAFDEAAKAQLSPSAAWYVPEELHLLKAEAETTLGSEGKTSQTVGPAPLSPP